MNQKKLPIFLKPSTRAWIREARQLKDYSLFDAFHGYIYARFPYFYISVGTGEHPLTRFIAPLATWIISLLTPHAKNGGASNAETLHTPPGALPNATAAGMEFANTYHGKVVPLEAAKQLVSIKQEIKITNLETVIPYTRARDIIMHDPDHIVVLDCPCRVAREHPCLPLDVCLIVGEPFASFIAEHQPKRSRWISSEEAVDILKAEDKRGHVHHAFFKDAMLGRFYAICNCCDCCCGAMQAHRTGTPMLTSSGYRAVINPERCNGCAVCTNFCQFAAISIVSNGKKQAVIDPEKCMGCGICVNHCARKGVTLERDVSSGEPLEMVKLMDLSVQ
ncbi:MAG TPA: 4Fe-4S binding protein [Anaerolineaceae bacterium]